MKRAFVRHKFLVTATVSMNETIVSKAYDVPELTSNLDLVHVMGYDLKNSNDNKAHVHSPLYGTNGLSVVSSVGQKMLNL